MPPAFYLHDAHQNCWLDFGQPQTLLQTINLSDIQPALQAIEKHTQTGGYAAGFLAYEAAPAFDTALQTHPPNAGFPLLWFGLFEQAPQRIQFPSPAAALPALHWQADTHLPDYRHTFKQIKRAIGRGETYQINHTFRLNAQIPLTAPANPLHSPLARLLHAQPTPYAACLSDGTHWSIFSASPECFFTRQDDLITCRPMKGTATRHPEPHRDQQRARTLHRSAKNRAENVMIVDMLRNDLGQIAQTGSVCVPQLFEIEAYPTVWQMTSTVQARSRAPLPELLNALFPCASITGAPKISACRIIRSHETTPRHIYTGSIGFIFPNGRAQFNVAIRTLLVHHSHTNHTQAQYGIGSGIVWDSRPAAEYAECLSKAATLRALSSAHTLKTE